MEGLRSWLLSVTCAAIIAALADALCPGGFPKKLTRAAGGLLVLLTVLGPAVELAHLDLADSLAKYRDQTQWDVQAIEVEGEELRKAIIERETAAYISDKAAALGIQDAQVWVNCRLTDEGFPAPESVKVRGSGAEDAWQALQRAITADFALEESAQTLERMDVP